MGADVLVVGAGIAGLSCAMTLSDAGRRVLVLEKSRGVGGRCATRRVDGSPVDHGPAFLHGSDEELRTLISAAAFESTVTDWPRRVRGRGTPCQPSAYRAGEWRLAVASGLTAFPKSLAAGLEVRLNSRVTQIESVSGRWSVRDENGSEFFGRDLALCVPPPQTLGLLDSWPEPPRDLRSSRWILSDVAFVSTLTVIADYPEGVPVPDWDMWYPEGSAILQLVSHDSSKRPQTVKIVLVLQGLPGWSGRQWDRSDAEWSAAMLEEAGDLVGRWAARPQNLQTHRWRYARIVSGGDLTGPMLLTLDGGCRLGFAGDAFSPGGGVQAAWRSGRELASRLLEEQRS